MMLNINVEHSLVRTDERIKELEAEREEYAKELLAERNREHQKYWSFLPWKVGPIGLDHIDEFSVQIFNSCTIEKLQKLKRLLKTARDLGYISVDMDADLVKYIYG